MRPLRLTACLLLAGACGSESGSEGEAEAEAEAEAEGEGGGETSVGDPCVNTGDCPGVGADPECLFPKRGWPDGYCTASDCDTDADCEGGTDLAVCVPVKDLFDTAPVPRCLLRCTDGGDCREGYNCLDLGDLGIGDAGTTACLPYCTDASDCGPGQTCDTTEQTCYTAGAQVGDPCANGWDCEVEQVCLSESFFGYPGGACSVDHCDNDGECPSGATCVGIGPSSGECHKACPGGDGDCTRTGYACTPCDGTIFVCTSAACLPDCSEGGCGAGNDCAPSGYCTGTWDSDSEGDDCEEAHDCPGGICDYVNGPGVDGVCAEN